MKTGQFERAFETNKTHWIVEGFSDQTKQFVYPHEGWSWTSWLPHVTDTYETFERAKSAVFGGSYLTDMIEYQKIKDINFFEIVTTQQIVEHKTITAYDENGQRKTYEPANYVTSLGDLSHGDYLIINDEIYGCIQYIRDGEMGIEVINGAWLLVLDVTGEAPVINTPDLQRRNGDPITINHIGVPDANCSYDDYDHQFLYYRENFDQERLTSTLRTAKPVPS